MGGCATKPKVSKDAEGKKAPEPINEDASDAAAQTQAEKPVAAEPKVINKPLVLDQEIVDADDDQANRRRSLSSLFKHKQDEDKKILTADEKSRVEEKEEAEAEAEIKKSLEEIRSDEAVKQETLEVEEKSTVETQSNEAVKRWKAEKKAAETAKEAIAKASGSSDLPDKVTEKPAEESEEKSVEAEDSETTAAEVATDKIIEVVETADAAQDKNQTIDSASKADVKH